MDSLLGDRSKFPGTAGTYDTGDALISHSSCGMLWFLTILFLYPRSFSLFSG